uniref:Uncharacterized protein n=1 Tax=Anguilla anguilla TaxID=7936 RepID=A0A0E9UFQ0_ANGAN
MFLIPTSIFVHAVILRIFAFRNPFDASCATIHCTKKSLI